MYSNTCYDQAKRQNCKRPRTHTNFLKKKLTMDIIDSKYMNYIIYLNYRVILYIYIYLRHSYRLHTTTCILSEKFQSALKISPTAIRHDIGHNFNLNNWQVYSIDFLHINNIIGAKERSSDIQTPFIYIQNPRGPSIFWDTQWG